MMMEKDVLLTLYNKMVQIRQFEEKLLELFSTRLMPGTMHQYNGQEAVAVGVCAHLDKDDYITSTHRGHGHCIAKGADLNAVMAEMFAKTTGCCKAMGGSMHIADFNVGMLGPNGIVAAGIPIAVGAGLSSQYQDNGRVCVPFFGDGAVNEGAFHEAVNLAAVWKLPVVFVCENNQYGFSTPVEETMAIEDISCRAAGYGIPGATVDGMDVLKVYDVAGEAVQRARRGDGPTLLEFKTYRYRGHSRFEDPSYRTKEEVATWQERDPIVMFSEYLQEEVKIPQEQLDQIDNEVTALMDRAVEFAEQSPDPQPQDYQQYIFA